MVRRVLALVMLTMLAAGCDSAAPVHVYSKVGVTLEQMTRDEAECARGAGGGGASDARLRRCMTDRGYVAQELRQGSYLELRGMQNP